MTTTSGNSATKALGGAARDVRRAESRRDRIRWRSWRARAELGPRPPFRHGVVLAVAFARAARCALGARPSHHRPKPSMMAAAMMPRPGAAKGVVPKNGIGMAFCRAGVPGNADMVKVMVPRAIAAGIRRCGMSAVLNRPCAMGTRTKIATNRLTPP